MRCVERWYVIFMFTFVSFLLFWFCFARSFSSVHSLVLSFRLILSGCLGIGSTQLSYVYICLLFLLLSKLSYAACSRIMQTYRHFFPCSCSTNRVFASPYFCWKAFIFWSQLAALTLPDWQKTCSDWVYNIVWQEIYLGVGSDITLCDLLMHFPVCCVFISIFLVVPSKIFEIRLSFLQRTPVTCKPIAAPRRRFPCAYDGWESNLSKANLKMPMSILAAIMDTI